MASLSVIKVPQILGQLFFAVRNILQCADISQKGGGGGEAMLRIGLSTKNDDTVVVSLSFIFIMWKSFSGLDT